MGLSRSRQKPVFEWGLRAFGFTVTFGVSCLTNCPMQERLVKTIEGVSAGFILASTMRKMDYFWNWM